MIVDPDMPDHWKVQMLVGMLDDDHAAPVYLIRLWGHCQNRKKDRFSHLPTMGLRAICKYPGDAHTFEQALIECGFVERDGESLIVIGWCDHNANLLKAWENGKKGGRPVKPKENPRVNPSNNPRDTNGLPDKEDEVDKEDKEEGERGAPRKRGCRIPESFPEDSDLTWAKEKFPAVNLATEKEKFRDYWKSLSGQKAVKLDWSATWRNWLRRSAEAKPATDDRFRGAL